MSYKLNKTDGSLLVELQDGVIDTTSSDLTLVGRNYKGFGEYINENYIALLENFASTSAPSNPISGQLWYDTSDQRLKIYNGTTFRVAGGPYLSASQPNMIAGDLWINNEENKLYFYDGTDLVAVGPSYTATQGKTTLEAVTMIDTSGQTIKPKSNKIIQKKMNKKKNKVVDVCTILEKCSIDEISKYLIDRGKKKNFPDITIRQ